MTDTLRQLSAEGVAIWLDDLSRGRLTTGNLADLIRDRFVVGVTTNPTIFQKAISDSELYDRQLRDLAVRGVDVNPAALDRATRARYSTWSLRDVPPTTQRQWFVADGRELLLARERLRPTVTFELLNLVSDVEPWPPGSLDVIFCRNVLMYLTPAHATAVVARLARGLAPGGFLFLGHAETLRGLSHDFHLRQTHGAFYYQRKDEVASDAAPVRELAMPAASTASTAWIDAVQASAARISALAARASAPPERRAPDARATALELLQGERFEEALVVLDGGGRADADALLLRAVLLAHAGRAGEAESTCARVLALDELNAGAHYTLALCRESAGDREGAIGHDQAAIYLDPTFAMPRLHLGLLARRNGLADDARRALREATALFEREDAARLLLFGGGFSRDALIALCRAELAAAGGAS